MKVVLDAHGRTPATAKVRDGRLLIDSGHDLPGLLDRLGSMGILSLLVEGGATVHGSFFDAGLVDRVYAYLAPIVVGGREAPSAVAGWSSVGPASSVLSMPLPPPAFKWAGAWRSTGCA